MELLRWIAATFTNRRERAREKAILRRYNRDFSRLSKEIERHAIDMERQRLADQKFYARQQWTREEQERIAARRAQGSA